MRHSKKKTLNSLVRGAGYSFGASGPALLIIIDNLLCISS
jgi:hypothetical protein